MVAEGEIAGDYLEELLDLLDFDGDIDLDVEGDRAVVSIDGGGDLNKLVGRKGEVLDALAGADAAGGASKDRRAQPPDARHRALAPPAPRRAGHARRARWHRRVLETGEREELAPMTPFERKIVHDAVAAVDGVHSESEGVEPSRRVVVLTRLTQSYIHVVHRRRASGREIRRMFHVKHERGVGAAGSGRPLVRGATWSGAELYADYPGGRRRRARAHRAA